MSKEISNLEYLIMTHKEIYYNGLEGRDDIKAISDSEFDKLEDELRELDPNNIVLQKVGTNGGKVKHSNPMLSIKKTKDENDVYDLLKKGNLIASYKMDGSACSLKYEYGQWISASTRGDGEFGNDVSKQMKYVNFPKSISNITEVRGEVVISKSNFEQLKMDMLSRSLDEPESIRNCVAGILNPNRKDNFDLAKHLTFIPYLSDNDLFYNDIFTYLSTFGFELPVYEEIISNSDVDTFITKYVESIKDYEYLTDGIVFRINDNRVANKQGKTSHHYKHSIAYKLEAETAITTIKNIIPEVNRTGKISYVAEIKKVKLSGATIGRVTLHNARNIIDNNLGVDAKIEIQRSNEIIPKYLKTIEGVNPYTNLSMFCPSCGESLSWGMSKADLLCTNNSCEGIFFYKVLHFIKTLEIDSFSDKTLRKLFNLGYIEDYSDIFKLTYKAFLQLPKFQKKSAENLYNNIQSKKNIPLATFLASLGISGLGKTASKLIVNKYKTWYDIFMTASVYDLEQIDGIGEVLANNFYNDIHNIATLKEHLEHDCGVTIIDANTTDDELSGGKLENMNIVITGSLGISRKQWKKDIEVNGGSLKSSVSKTTDILVCNDQDSSSSKMRKAKELNIKIVSEDELIELFK